MLRYSDDRKCVIDYLLQHCECDPNSPTSSGETPLELTGKVAFIQVLLKHGALPTYKHINYLPKRMQKDPAGAVMKMFVVGHSGAGKSTLVESLKSEKEGLARFIYRITKVKGVDKRTAGIIPHDIESPTFGRVTLYDLAGQHEFHASHDTLLRSSMGNSPSIILLVVDISDEEGKFTEALHYWLEFINNQCTKGTPGPHLFIIGSHADKISSRKKSERLDTLKTLISNFDISNVTCAGQDIVDCRYAVSDSISRLRFNLSTICQNLRSSKEISLSNHCFLVLLLDKFRDVHAVTLADVKKMLNASVEEEEYLKFLKDLDVECTCKQLNKQGNILFMENKTNNSENSWIVFNKSAMLHIVNGNLFAPKGFKEHQSIATSTGVVPLSKISSLCKDLDSDMVAQFLCHLEFCQEIKKGEDSSSSTERFFFFPGLVSLNPPPNLWQQNKYETCYSGWLLRCSTPKQFFSTRFLEVLLLRLAFGFDLCLPQPDFNHPALLRGYCIWKNGISWTDLSGVEVIVEIIDLKRVMLVLRSPPHVKEVKDRAADTCPKIEMMELIRFRSAVIKIVLQTKMDFCPKVCVQESLILPENLAHYPLKRGTVKTISIVNVSHSVEEGKPYVHVKTPQIMKLDSLLHFEPYAQLGRNILRKLFNEDDPEYHREIENELVHCIVDKVCKAEKIELFIQLLEVSITELEQLSVNKGTDRLVKAFNLWKKYMKNKGLVGSLYNLRKKLDKWSIFAGRNPLVVSTGMCIATRCSHYHQFRIKSQFKCFHHIGSAALESPLQFHISSICPWVQSALLVTRHFAMCVKYLHIMVTSHLSQVKSFNRFFMVTSLELESTLWLPFS